MNQQITVDGLFEVIRTHPKQPAAATNRLILICRAGRLFGADPEGRVYMGRLFPRPARAARRSLLKGVYEIPLRSSSRRHLMYRHPSVRVPITGEVDPLARSQSTTVRVGCRQIDIEITYLGPLPP